MVFNVTFNNISAISWRSVLFMEETGGSTRRKPPTCRKSLTKTLEHYIEHYLVMDNSSIKMRDRRGLDRMVVWIYNYLCNQCLSPLKLRVQFPLMVSIARNHGYFCSWISISQIASCMTSANKRWTIFGRRWSMNADEKSYLFFFNNISSVLIT